eukprot:438954-Prorocentrum_lima.AAC.1
MQPYPIDMPPLRRLCIMPGSNLEEEDLFVAFTAPYFVKLMHEIQRAHPAPVFAVGLDVKMK